MRIVLCFPNEARHREQMLRVAPEAEIVNASYENIAEQILEADVFCGHDRFLTIPWDEVVRRGKLRYIQSTAAGMDHCLVDSVIESDITVCSASGVLADQVADQTMALLFGWSRSLGVFVRAQQAKEFVRRPTRDVHRSTIGIVGFGGNGRRLAEVLAPFRCRILATDYFPLDKPAHVEQLWGPERLNDLLPQLDYLILSAPLNGATRGMIDARALRLMKPTACLVNVARGPLVVERDLVAALREQRLAGAAVDVTEVEPLPSDSPLWDMPNVLITPHVGGQSGRRAEDMTNLFSENLRRYLSGEPLFNLLTDKRLGFPHPSQRPPAWVYDPGRGEG